MTKFNINDPYDIAEMNALFDKYSEDDWEKYKKIAVGKKIGFRDTGLLTTAIKKAHLSKYLSPKQIVAILALVEKLDEMIADDERNVKTVEFLDSPDFNMPVSHVTLRVAWHDNKWNGTICNNPENNTYCNGFHSLLSERIRKRKDENMDEELANRGKPINEVDYLPPCFWSTNLFGNENVKINFDNPAAPALIPITDKLPSNSILSWPFSVSFTRTKTEQAESGAYPKNLQDVRIPRFNSKIHEGKSIGFMYANFSNPITDEEQQYLVVGAGIISNKEKASEIKHFGPKSEIEAIKARPKSNFKYRNFPSMNWAMRFSFEDYSTVRMPYHEYLEAAEKLTDESKDSFFDNIKVAITEPELVWCFKYVAMDIGDDEAIYVLTKMRKAIITCKDDGVVPRADMVSLIEKVDGLLHLAWSSRSYFPGFVSISRVLLNQQDEPQFELEDFYNDFKDDQTDAPDKVLADILNNPSENANYKPYVKQIKNLTDRLIQRGLSIEQFLTLAMLNLKPFQFERVISGKLTLPKIWVKDFDNEVKRSHNTVDIIENPYLLYEDYQFWSDSHDNVYGEERDAPIDLFKIDIAYFPHSQFKSRMDLQRQKMSFIDKKRIRALVIRHLNTLENKGDCFTDAMHLQTAVESYPLFYDAGTSYELPPNFFHPIGSELANHFQTEPNKLVLIEANETTYFYLASIFNAEKHIEKKIHTLLKAPDHNEQYPGVKEYIEKSILKLKKSIGEVFDVEGFREERERLYINIFKKSFFIIAGSAGSGKSYEILNIIKDFEKRDRQKYLLLAPTGKAALRLSNDLNFRNVTAYTIDKFITDVTNRKISATELTEYKNVIVDETSMVDLLKFDRLLSLFNFKEPSFKRLILIGDPNQLPAIGYGRVLDDTITFLRTHNEFRNNFIQLETNCRSELKDNDVLTLAEAFKQKGEFDSTLLNKFKDQKSVISAGFKARYWSTKDELYQFISEEFDTFSNQSGITGNRSARLDQLLGLSKDGNIVNKKVALENFQILTPYNSQSSGTYKINDFIQTSFKTDLPLAFRKNLYKRADKLIRTKNYYESKNLVLSNGTLGFIMDQSNETFVYESANGPDKILFDDIRKSEQEFFELAYAITVHKSQGSGFDHLFLILPSRFGLLSKELVYTALTRTKKSITLFLQLNDGRSQSVLELAQSRSFSASRWTSLLLDKPFQFYDLEPEPGIYVESRVELLIYHLLMMRRNELDIDLFNFSYEAKPIVDNIEINIRTDFTIVCNNRTWYWEHLGLLDQRKYRWTWQNLKKKTYQEAGIWQDVITTDERNGLNPTKINEIIDLIIINKVATEDKHCLYSNHHYYLR